MIYGDDNIHYALEKVAAPSSKAKKRREREKRRRLMDRLDAGLLGGALVGGYGPAGYMKATGKVGVPNLYPIRGALAGASLAGLYHLLRERNSRRK